MLPISKIVTKMTQSNAPWLEGIDGADAQNLIESDSQVIRVVAGPGSGKTTCLKSRIQKLIMKDNIDPSKIFVGTFTRAVAKELRDKIDKRVKVSTLHSFAYEQLRNYPEACQGMKLRFLLQYEEDSMLYDIKNAVPEIIKNNDRRKALKKWQASIAGRTEHFDAKLSGAVRDWLLRHSAMLIEDVGHLCVTALESKDIPPGSFDHVVIDEYQDLTAVEQELVRLIWSKNGALTIMGDDDQSIYNFRFNYPRGLEKFRDVWKDWGDFEDLELIYNFRCGKEILEIANVMMAQAGSAKKPMIPMRLRAGKRIVVTWASLEEEIAGLAKYIGIHANETFLVLVPRRFIGYLLADAIGEDAKTSFSEQILEHPIAQESFAAVSLLANPMDFVATRAYLGFHGRKPIQASRRNTESYVRLPQDASGHELLRRIANEEINLSGEGRSNIKERAKQAVALIERSLEPNDIVDLLFDDALAKQECDDKKSRRLAENLRGLHSATHELLAQQDTPDLSEVMAALRYRIATRAPLRSSELLDPRVQIMTLHSVKGLEADNVVVAGVVDQFVPGPKTDLQDIKEQQRLLYVAVTRAKDSLIISWPRKIPLVDILRNNGREGGIVTHNRIRYGITSRSSLLPQRLHGVTDGDELLATLTPE